MHEDAVYWCREYCMSACDMREPLNVHKSGKYWETNWRVQTMRASQHQKQWICFLDQRWIWGVPAGDAETQKNEKPFVHIVVPLCHKRSMHA
jgi:hypothetical protein